VRAGVCKMGFIISAIVTIVIVLGILVSGFFARKKYYNEMDRLEKWKIDIFNRPVPDELSKVKQLNMTGQTEELFEKWRSDWDEIVAGQLPDVEELLFDAEEAIDKFKLRKAKEIQGKIVYILEENEAKIEKILAELNELVGSEQKNREEMEELKQLYRESKKTLLAHRHSFGKTVEVFEKQLDDMVNQFQSFEEKTENGNYLEAREVVLTIKDKLTKISHKMQIIPELLMDCQTALPMQMNELKDGYQEMLEQGYRLEHLQIEQQLVKLEEQIQLFLAKLLETEVEEAQAGLEAVKDAIENIYVQLEKEVMAKHFIEKNLEAVQQALAELYDHCQELKEETEYVQQIYHLAEDGLKAQKQTEKQLNKLFKRYQQLEIKISQNDLPQTHLADELDELKQMIDKLQQEQKEYREKLDALRKDEMTARAKVKELKHTISESIRNISKSNIPGLPKEYEFLLDDAKESIETVMEKLAEKPLDIPTVQHYLDLAVFAVDELAKKTNELIETVELAEKVIQYGNRYKSRYKEVADGLEKAELAFRDFDYKAALEQAATTVEKVEPGAMKKIEALMSEKIL
jgi:septation ring formation regulator